MIIKIIFIDIQMIDSKLYKEKPHCGFANFPQQKCKSFAKFPEWSVSETSFWNDHTIKDDWN